MSPAELSALTDDELEARRIELAETVGPMLLRLEMIDDIRMARRRAAQRARILVGPMDTEHAGGDAPSTEGL